MHDSRMKILCIVLFTALAVSQVASQLEYNYEDQAAWANLPGSFCGIGRAQSPINIVKADAVPVSPTLLPDLRFIGWDGAVDGSFANMGHNVQFNPSTTGATTVNHRGTYDLLQFHLHWGAGHRDGSEHRVDGAQYDAEIHFVHRRKGDPTNSTARDTLTVVGVFGVAAFGPITGIWRRLMPVPTEFESSTSVTGIRYSDLLPTNRDYYYYEGSLTTPLCNEIVQWFVLKNPILIPTRYLTMLRNVQEDARGTLLTHNVRDAQALNGRFVFEQSATSSKSEAMNDIYTCARRTRCGTCNCMNCIFDSLWKHCHATNRESW